MDEIHNDDDNEKLKNEIILTLLDSLYKGDEKNYKHNFEILQSLDIIELDKMMGEYYLNMRKN